MSIFEHRKPGNGTPPKDRLQVLRNALAALESELQQSPRISADLESQRKLIR
jgi:hypothetical protein